MVPGTTLADLDYVDLELCIFRSHFVQFRAALYPALIPAELVAIDVRDVGQLGVPADRTGDVGALAVELGRPEQVWMRIADISHGGAAGQDRGERRPPGKPVVDHRSPHVRQVTTEPAAAGAQTGHRIVTAERARHPCRAPDGQNLRHNGAARIFVMYQFDTSTRHVRQWRASCPGC